jgi:hypothetical protein
MHRRAVPWCLGRGYHFSVTICFFCKYPNILWSGCYNISLEADNYWANVEHFLLLGTLGIWQVCSQEPPAVRSLCHMSTVTPSRPVPVWRSLRNHIVFLKCKSDLCDTSRLTWDDLPLDLACSVWLSVFHKVFSWHLAIYNVFGVSDWVTPRCLDYQVFHGYGVDTVFFVRYALRPKK